MKLISNYYQLTVQLKTVIYAPSLGQWKERLRRFYNTLSKAAGMSCSQRLLFHSMKNRKASVTYLDPIRFYIARG